MDYYVDTKKLRIAMAIEDLNVAQLAKKAELSQPTVRTVVAGELPSGETMRRIGKALNLAPTDMVDIFFSVGLAETQNGG